MQERVKFKELQGRGSLSAARTYSGSQRGRRDRASETGRAHHEGPVPGAGGRGGTGEEGGHAGRAWGSEREGVGGR